MRVLFAISTLGNGGAERVVANLSNQFAADGHEVSIVTIYSDRKDYAIDSHVTLYNAAGKSSSRIIRTIGRMRAIRKLVKRIRPDVVISFLADVNLYVIVSLLGIKQTLVVSERNDPASDPPQQWMRTLRNRLYARVNGVVFQTEDAKAYFNGVLPAAVHTAVIPNPLEGSLPLYRPEAAGRQFIVASRLNRQKNLPMVIEAMRLLISRQQDCTVSIYGEGPEKGRLLELIHRYHLDGHVLLEGFTQNIHEYMQTACALIISSDYEGISNSMLEALGIGLPVISTDCPVGGARMFIRQGVNGVLIKCGDAAGLANAMQTMLADRSIAGRHQENALAIRERLSLHAIARQWYDFLKRPV